jgi:hypothetical protein
VSGFVSGEAAAHAALNGEKGFLTPARLNKYDTERNNPTKPQVRWPMLNGPSSPNKAAFVAARWMLCIHGFSFTLPLC